MALRCQLCDQPIEGDATVLTPDDYRVAGTMPTDELSVCHDCARDLLDQYHRRTEQAQQD